MKDPREPKDPRVLEIVEAMESCIEEMTLSVGVLLIFDRLDFEPKTLDRLSSSRLNEVFKSVYERLDDLQVRLSRPREGE